MRSNRKQIEVVALSLFARALESEGIAPLYFPEIVDRPDALFLIEERKVALECRYASHPELIRLIGLMSTWDPDSVYEVLLPCEPHLWVKLAIDDKSHRVPDYLTRTGADAAWLLLHSSHYHPILREDRSEGSPFFQLLRLGAHLTRHPFEQIWLSEISTTPARAIRIFVAGEAPPEITFDEYRKIYSSYPLDQYFFSRCTVRSRAGKGKGISVSLNNLVAEPLCLQPLQPGQHIDFAPLLSNEKRKANLTGLHVRVWKDKPRL